MNSSKLIPNPRSVEERYIIINACSKRYQQRININTSFIDIRSISHGMVDRSQLCSSYVRVYPGFRMSSQYSTCSVLVIYRLLGEVVAIVYIVFIQSKTSEHCQRLYSVSHSQPRRLSGCWARWLL